MNKMEIMIIADYSETTVFDVQTMCELSACDQETLLLCMQYELIKPIARSENGDWLFDTQALTRLQSVLRLQRDFDLTLPGLALVLDLIAERDALLERNALLERHLFG